MLLGTNRPEGWVRTDRKVGMKRPSLGTNHLGTKDPWVRNDWIPPPGSPRVITPGIRLVDAPMGWEFDISGWYWGCYDRKHHGNVNL